MYLEQWAEHVHLTKDITEHAERAEFYAKVRRGEFVALYRGIYVSSKDWNSLDRHGKYRSRVKAAARTANGLILSHESAAALWRLPSLGSWPRVVHHLAPGGARGHTTKVFASHTAHPTEKTEVIDGLTVTSLARTVIDLAAGRSFASAVVVADAALRRTTHPVAGLPPTSLTRLDLQAELAHLALRHGTAKALRVIEFADGRSDRPGESISRVSMAAAGLPAPRLQVRLAGASGRVYVVDFWWPACELIGEFDGDDKYKNPEFLRGRTPEQALLDEKAREDDLRAAGHGMSRWGWEIAKSPRLLRAHLVAAGLR